MHWKAKALIQNVIARLPGGMRDAVYGWMQRRFGGLQVFQPERRLEAARTIWSRLQDHGPDPEGATFLEVGTGHVPVLPAALWLMGAKRVITVDVNRYLQPQRLQDWARYAATHADALHRLLGPALRPDRLDALAALAAPRPAPPEAILRTCGVDYRAPVDGGSVPLPDNHVDVHVSFTVLEHIPPESLRAVLREGVRLVRPGGALVHCIDYSDHFAHGDPTLAPIHFLQYPDAAWARYAGNKYMYMNRLRHDDFLDLARASGLHLLDVTPHVDPGALTLLQSGTLPLAPRFQGKSLCTLATLHAWITARPVDGESSDASRE